MVTRKASRKASHKASRKQRKATRKGKKGLSPALKEWNRKVMEIFKAKRKNNPSYRLMDAMKEAKKTN